MTKSEQSRADALADAETLRIHASADIGFDLYQAQVLGAYVAEYNLRPQDARRYSVRAARLAFQAVPGLRGDAA